MELVTMSREHYEEAIRDNTAVKMALEYLDECESNEEQPDTNWLRFLLNGGPMDYWPEEILREEDCPEEPRTHKKGHPVLEHLMPDGEHDLEQI